MTNPVDVGQTYGRWTVLQRTTDSTKSSYWLCKCECGSQKDVFSGSLQSGRSRSCGCLSREVAAQTIKHGATSGYEYSPEYSSWMSMRERCSNPNHKYFHNYGGRGIGFDESWEDFAVFLKDMGPRPKGTSLDRKDNSKGYNADNCKWSTRQEQNENARHVIRVRRSDGREFKSLSAAARSVGGTPSGLSGFLGTGSVRYGYTWERAT